MSYGKENPYEELMRRNQARARSVTNAYCSSSRKPQDAKRASRDSCLVVASVQVGK
jgi:hypothetical protein